MKKARTLQLKTSDFDYTLPPELIANEPLRNRETAHLMVIDPVEKSLKHQQIADLEKILTPNDVLVFNETKVFPARVKGMLGGKPVELLLIKPVNENTWECLTKPGRRFQEKSPLDWGDLQGTVVNIQPDGSRWIEFSQGGNALDEWIDQHGETPLPPYLKGSTASPQDYQTVYAKHRGSVAAPTAGLHFTHSLLKRLEQKGIERAFVTLHVGRGTFEPVKVESLKDHPMHTEWYEINESTAQTLNAFKAQGKRIIAVGTTSARTLESASTDLGELRAGSGETNLFITPGYSFRFIDGLLTNFHLPKSTLLMMVSALAGKGLIEKAYAEAIQKKYRFFSFGDAMLILK